MAELLSSLLQRAADGRPDHPAVECAGSRLTYRKLAESAGRLARALAAAGVAPGDRVGILMPKSLEAVAGLYGALWAGGAYVPLDVGAPDERLAYMIRNCGMKVVITCARQAQRLVDRLGGTAVARLILFDADQVPENLSRRSSVPILGRADLVGHAPLERPAAVFPDALAYILYTSGSTGEPKGVMISHRNAMAFVAWACETIGVGAEDRLSGHAPFQFDLSIFDLYVACLAQATVVLVPDDVSLFPASLAAWIERQRISVWYSVPSALVRLLDGGRLERFVFSHLRKMLFAGEVFAPKYLRAWMRKVPQADWYNLYGPTETNVCTYHPVREAPTDDEPIPIGRAASDDTVHLRDESGNPITEPGRDGEIWVEGPTVALGYWGDADKTAERFVSDGGCPGPRGRCYRTGDLACWNAGGDLVFRGRRDNMIKCRGYRIELGEIEAASLAHPAVQEACAVAIPDGEIGNRIRACIVAGTGSGLDRSEFEQHLARRLPRYMLPQEVVFCSGLPKTSTGKVDRRVLAGDLSALGDWMAS